MCNQKERQGGVAIESVDVRGPEPARAVPARRDRATASRRPVFAQDDLDFAVGEDANDAPKSVAMGPRSRSASIGHDAIRLTSGDAPEGFRAPAWCAERTGAVDGAAHPAGPGNADSSSRSIPGSCVPNTTGCPHAERILVGADGVGSKVRQQYLPHAKIVDTGIVAIAGKLHSMRISRQWLPEPFVTSIEQYHPSARVRMFIAQYLQKPERGRRRAWCCSVTPFTP